MSGSKTSTQPSSRSQNPISSNPLGLPTTPAVKPKETITLGNGSQSNIGYRKPGLAGAFEENINGGYASPLQKAQSDKLKGFQQAYKGDQEVIQSVQSQPLNNNGQINQGYTEEEKELQEDNLKGSRGGYLYNKILRGFGEVAAGVGDVATQLAASAQPRANDGTPRDRFDQAAPLTPEQEQFRKSEIKDYRENTAPTIREYLKEKLGTTVDKRLEGKYDNETFTSAIGGLAQSVPSIAATMVSGGAGTAAIASQMFDNAIESINNTEVGRNLDEDTKSLFGGGVALVNTMLEKAGLEYVLKSKTGIVSDFLTKMAVKKAAQATGGNVTGDIFTKFLNKEVIDLTNKYLTGGVRAVDGAIAEYATEFAQEGTSIGAELLTNKSTGKPVFNTKDLASWDGFVDNLKRANKSGIGGLIGGGLLGSVSSLANINKNKIVQIEDTIKEIDKNLQKEGLSENTKELLVQHKIKLQKELQEHADKIDAKYAALDAKKKAKVNEIVENKIKVDQAIADENISPEIKTTLESQSEELDKQLSEIKPVEPIKVVSEVITPVGEVKVTEDVKTTPIDGASEGTTEGAKVPEYFNVYEDIAKKSVNSEAAFATIKENLGGLSDTFNKKYNPDGKLTPEQAFEKFYDEVKQPVEAKEKANTPEFNLNDVKKPSGSIGNQGATETGAKSILDHLGINVTFKGEPTMREMVEHLKNNSKDRQKLLDFVKNEPIVLRELPDGTYQLEDGHHRATLLYYSGVENVPANIVNKGEYIDKNKTTINTETTQETVTEEVVAPIQEATINKPKEEQLTPKPKFTIKGETITPKIDAETKSELPIKEVPIKEETEQIKEEPKKKEVKEEEKPKTSKEKISDIEVKRQSIKDRISTKLKEQRGNLSTGFDPSLLKDFIELGSTYIEEGIVKASDFIKRFREDYKDMGFDDSGITDEEITDKIFTKANPQETVEEKPKTEAKEKPKAKKQTEFDELANKRLPTRETRETASNVERETGDELKTSIKEFEGVDFRQSMAYGESVVEAAKVEFGDSYVTDLLEYVEESKMPFENKAVILVSLENNLRKQLLENPKDKRLRKQINVVTKASIEHLRSGATAAAVGIFRQAARVNYETQLAAEAIFSPKEMEARSKVEQAVYSTPEDVQKQYELREAEIDQAIAEGVEKRINEIYESLPTARRQKADKAIAALDKIQKRLRSKTYDASIGVPVAIIDAGISTIKAAIKAGVNIADAVEAGIKKIREDYGKKWEKEDDFRKDMIDGFSAEGINASTDVTTNLKKELIDAGYGKEITVTTKDGKEKRKVYDWKKLLGVEGSFENLADALEKSMKGKGYSQAEIDAFQAQLQDEYNDIHADIIEKSVNELNRRNTPKDGSAKPLARRLAELYNLGIYEQEPDTYSNILNNILGVTPESQEAFNEIRDFNRSLAKLLETKDANGNPLSDVALASAETQIKDKIKRVIDKAQFADGSGLYKFSVIMKNLFSAMQRMLLVSPGQLIENPFSGIQNDVHVQLQDAFKKGSWDTKELAKYRKMISKAMYKDISLAQGGEYGGVGNPFTSKNSIDEFVKGLSKNGLYQAFITASSGKAYLDAADSYFKVKRTENEFTHNLIRILTDKTNPNGAMSQEEALKYVSEIITGQSFEDAKKVAENIINDINKEAGKEVLRATDTNILRIANDVVKDSLVNGGGFTYDQVEASFKAAYRTAGKSMGHEANNFVSMGVQAINQKLQTNINNALKKKDYDAAAMWTMALTMSRNIISPFVGGGSNWVVIGLQKMGIPTEYFNPSVGWRKKPIDLSSKQGMKELEDALAANATRSRMYGRMLVGTTTALVAAMAMRAGMDEDEYRKWRRQHPETRKLIDKIQPVPITMMLARKDGSDELIKAMADAVGSRQNFDALKTKRATKEFIEAAEVGNEKAAKKAWGIVGEMVGRKFTVPYLSNISTYGRAQDKIIKEFMKEKPTTKPPSQGFVEGYFRGGLLDYLFGGEEEKPEK